MKDEYGRQFVYAVFVTLYDTTDGHGYTRFCGNASSADKIEGILRMALGRTYGTHTYKRRLQDGTYETYEKEIWPDRFNKDYDISIFSSTLNECDFPHEYSMYKDFGAYFPKKDVKIIEELLEQLQKEMDAHEFEIDYHDYLRALTKQENKRRGHRK